jgi:hypothetical protein
MASDILVKRNGTGIKDFLAALVKPLQTNTDLLDDFEAQETKRATWNGQKIVLEAALNDLFGITVAPFIYIEMNRSVATNTYFYQPSEFIPVYFSQPSENDPVYLSQESELSAVDYDFTVFIPVGIHTAELERRVRAETNLYKVVGPNFDIQTF